LVPARGLAGGRGEPAPSSWLDRGLALRDRLLASPRFRRWAAAFPPTRPIARRRARAVFDLCAGFVYAQVLLACVRLRLFDTLLEGGPRTAAELAPSLALAPEAAERLLAAAASLRLLERRSGGRYGLGPLGAAVAGNPGLAAMVEHHTMLYADLRDPVALLRGERRGETELARYWPYAGAGAPTALGAGEVGPYTALMAASQAFVADEVLDAYPALARHRCLLDVGGGDGTFLAAAAARASDLRLVLFDLPPVAERARARLAAAGLADRARAVGGDFLADPLPEGADVVSLVRVVHDHDDAAALALLRAVRRALPDDGALLLAEPMSGTPGAEPSGDAYFGFYLLAMGSGRPRTAGELVAMLGAAGFGRVRPVPTRNPLVARLLVARP
jgi:demethylspheroidene O-methyltransferase